MPNDMFQTLSSIFGPPRRLIIPLYQRNYVWNKEDQWEPLWEDIERVADQMCGDRANARRHFLGATVLVQLPTQIGDVDQREVIDGQQRLTTLQIVLKAFRDECALQGFQDIVDGAENCIFNPKLDVKTKEDLVKLTPTLNDQSAFTQILEAPYDMTLSGEHPLIEAHAYFRDAIGAWIQGDVDRAKSLYTVLTRMLTLVVIDLDSHDEAQVVFETLNARGQPLLQSDLIKNHLIHHAHTSGKDVEALHKEYWSKFEVDHKFWRKQVGRGHARRMVIEQFFFNYLTLVTREEIASSKLYDTFKKHCEASGANTDPKPEMGKIATHARHYRRLIEGVDLQAAEMELRETMNSLGFTALHPFMLGILETLGEAPKAREAIAKDLESWLIRRTVCRMNTRGYNRFCVELVQFVPQNTDFNPDGVVAAVRKHLKKQTADSFRWPSDEEFKQSWLDRPLYVELTQPRIRRLLSRVEMEIRNTSGGKSENFDPHQSFTIEHLMPRSWTQHWPLPEVKYEEGEEVTAAATTEKIRELTQIRNRKLHTIGNLTLLTGNLNSSVSNSSWQDRRAAIKEHSTLRLNQRVVDLGDWSEERITERAVNLFNFAKKIWSIPECQTEEGKQDS